MAGQLGFSVLVGRLFGSQESFDFTPVKGATLAAVEIDDVTLRLRFADGRALVITDEGQSCCERRYMDTDDDVPWFVGARLENIELRDGPEQEDEDGECHQTQFIHVVTSKGVLNICSHNEHNGYYGGFDLRAELVEGTTDGAVRPPN